MTLQNDQYNLVVAIPLDFIFKNLEFLSLMISLILYPLRLCGGVHRRPLTGVWVQVHTHMKCHVMHTQ